MANCEYEYDGPTSIVVSTSTLEQERLKAVYPQFAHELCTFRRLSTTPAWSSAPAPSSSSTTLAPPSSSRTLPYETQSRIINLLLSDVPAPFARSSYLALSLVNRFWYSEARKAIVHTLNLPLTNNRSLTPLIALINQHDLARWVRVVKCTIDDEDERAAGGVAQTGGRPASPPLPLSGSNGSPPSRFGSRPSSPPVSGRRSPTLGDRIVVGASLRDILSLLHDCTNLVELRLSLGPLSAKIWNESGYKALARLPNLQMLEVNPLCSDAAVESLVRCTSQANPALDELSLCLNGKDSITGDRYAKNVLVDSETFLPLALPFAHLGSLPHIPSHQLTLTTLSLTVTLRPTDTRPPTEIGLLGFAAQFAPSVKHLAISVNTVKQMQIIRDFVRIMVERFSEGLETLSVEVRCAAPPSGAPAQAGLPQVQVPGQGQVQAGPGATALAGAANIAGQPANGPTTHGILSRLRLPPCPRLRECTLHGVLLDQHTFTPSALAGVIIRPISSSTTLASIIPRTHRRASLAPDTLVHTLAVEILDDEETAFPALVAFLDRKSRSRSHSNPRSSILASTSDSESSSESPGGTPPPTPPRRREKGVWKCVGMGDSSEVEEDPIVEKLVLYAPNVGMYDEVMDTIRAVCERRGIQLELGIGVRLG